MKRTRINPDINQFPDEIRHFLEGASIYDSSCSEEAKVYFIDSGIGYYLKEAECGNLKSESLMHEYFHSLGLTSAMLVYQTTDDRDYLITERVSGEDCTNSVFLEEPKKLCDTIATTLRKLHEMPVKNCPIQNRVDWYIRSVFNGYAGGKYESDLFERIWEFPSDTEAWEAARVGMTDLEQNVLMHGDYCLPNIMLDNWKFSGFVDLINAGVGDRHIDILWGIWTLKYNLGTEKYGSRFMDAYGRDVIEEEKLRCIAAMEMFGG